MIVIEDKWRYNLDFEDPYGSNAIYGAISKVMLGLKYSKNGEVKLLLNQAAFLAYVVSAICIDSYCIVLFGVPCSYLLARFSNFVWNLSCNCRNTSSVKYCLFEFFVYIHICVCCLSDGVGYGKSEFKRRGL